KLASLFLKNNGTPTVELFNPKGQAYDPALEKTYSYDVAGAKKLLAQAGYPNGFSVQMPSFVTTSVFNPTVAQALADIGIKVTWAPVPLQQQVPALTSGKFPMYFNIYGLDTDADLIDTYFGTQATAANPFASTDPELSKLVAQANAGDTTAYKKINEFAV